MNTYEFLAKILPPTGVFYIATRAQGAERTYFKHAICESPARAAQMALHLDAQGEQVYHACAAYREPYIDVDWTDPKTGVTTTKKRQRVQENVQSIRAFWLDLDVEPGNPAKYPSQSAAVAAMGTFIKSTGLPVPMFVSSGYGIHVYWTLVEAVQPAQWHACASLLKALTQATGLITDPTRTSDSASVLRPPGTYNRKGGNVVPVEVLRDAEPVTFTDFYALVTRACGGAKVEAPKAPTMPKGGVNDQYLIPTDYPPSRAGLVADKCQQIRAVRDTKGNVAEPVWYSAIQVLFHTIESESIIHEWSCGHPAYTPAETARKIDQIRSMGPTTCKTFNERNPEGCLGCPFAGKITSPIQLGTASNGTAAVNPDQDPRARLNASYAWIEKQAQIWRFDHRDFIRPQDFKIALMNEPPVTISPAGRPRSLADAWLQWPDRRQHRGIVYRPGAPLVIDNCVNLWPGWGCCSVAGDTTPWQQLMTTMFLNAPEHRKYFEQWIAYQIQHPGTKLSTAVVLWSRIQGIGKTLVGQTIGRLFGENFAVITDVELHSSFNGWARAKQFILGEENASKDHRGDANRLKHLITGDTIHVNEKYQPAVSLPNTLNFMFTSNHPDAFHLDTNDRRYFVWEVTGDKPTNAFFTDFVNWCDERGGTEALMNYFAILDLAGFNPKAAAPATRARSEMIELSYSDLERWIQERAADPASADGREIVELNELALKYKDDTGNRTSTTAIGRALARKGLTVSRRISVGGVRRSLRAIRRPDHWQDAPDTEWATAWLQTPWSTSPQSGTRDRIEQSARVEH